MIKLSKKEKLECSGKRAISKKLGKELESVDFIQIDEVTPEDCLKNGELENCTRVTFTTNCRINKEDEGGTISSVKRLTFQGDVNYVDDDFEVTL